MKDKLMEKYIRISRIIITIMVFTILNIWLISENDPNLVLTFIISIIVFIINYPSSKICVLLIKNGDKITSTFLKILYYIFVLPIIFILILILTALLCSFIVDIFESSINLGTAMLIAFTGIGLFTCILVPYFQTIIILILRHFKKKNI